MGSPLVFRIGVVLRSDHDDSPPIQPKPPRPLVGGAVVAIGKCWATARYAQAQCSWYDAGRDFCNGARPVLFNGATMNKAEFRNEHEREAIRLRKLVANATTPALKARLLEEAEKHEQLAEQLEAFKSQPSC